MFYSLKIALYNRVNSEIVALKIELYNRVNTEFESRKIALYNRVKSEFVALFNYKCFIHSKKYSTIELT